VATGGRVVEFADPEIGEYAVATAFHSRDGTTWQAVALATYSPLDRVEGVAVGDVAVAVGCTGCTSVGGADPEIAGIAWTSVDGINWQSRQPFGAGSVPGFVTALESGFVAVGTTGLSWSQGGEMAPAVWTSADGVGWDGPHELLSCPGCTVSDVIEHDGRLLTVANDGENAQLWASSDGKAWQVLESDVPKGVNGLVGFGEALLGFGYVCEPVNPNRPESPNVCEGVLATSGDGLSWTRSGSRLVDRLIFSDAVVVNGVLVVLGQDEDDNLVVLSSSDGSDWDTLEDLSGVSAGAGRLHVATYNNVVVVTTAEDGGSRLLATLLGG
jgi:hypothetical protein